MNNFFGGNRPHFIMQDVLSITLKSQIGDNMNPVKKNLKRSIPSIKNIFATFHEELRKKAWFIRLKSRIGQYIHIWAIS